MLSIKGFRRTYAVEHSANEQWGLNGISLDWLGVSFVYK